jgi:hypothetical protein
MNQKCLILHIKTNCALLLHISIKYILQLERTIPTLLKENTNNARSSGLLVAFFGTVNLPNKFLLK